MKLEPQRPPHVWAPSTACFYDMVPVNDLKYVHNARGPQRHSATPGLLYTSPVTLSNKEDLLKLNRSLDLRR